MSRIRDSAWLVEGHAHALDDPDVGVRLGVAASLARLAAELEQAAVDEARAVGRTWAEIGEWSGAGTRQAAHSRYRRRTVLALL